MSLTAPSPNRVHDADHSTIADDVRGAHSLHPVVSGRSDFQPAFLTGDSAESREPTDYYKTPEHATRPLLARENFDGIVWECACGDGAISRMLPGEVISTDLYNRGFGESGVDFLATVKQVNHVVTNPPYSLAQKFVEHALRCASGKVAMLLANRISFDKANVKGKGNGLLAYAWFVWEIGYRGKPTLEWIKSESANESSSPTAADGNGGAERKQ